MPPAEPVLVARNVTRRFGHRRVLSGVNLELRSGDALLLLGPNGAGKTTLLRVLAGLLRPDTGTIERRGAVGMVAHDSMLYDALTARENLRFFARLHGGGAARRVEALLERMGLAAVGEERVAAFSRGMTQRLAIARALLHDPEVLLWDEPLSGLDEQSSSKVLEVVAELTARGRSLLIASHQLAGLLGVVTAAGFLARGELQAVEPTAGRGAEAISGRYRELLDRG